MKYSTTKALTSALICGACLLSASSSWAVTFNLRAASFTKSVTPPGGTARDVLMWGFALDGAAPTSPGPALSVLPAETQLIIRLKNDLTVPVSLVVPGLQDRYVRSGLTEHSTFTDAAGRTRARSFVKETAPGETVEYVFDVTGRNGTYLYHSGSHPALQVQMGLYGMLTRNAATAQAYPGVTFISQASWIFGEIDFEVHDAVQAGTYQTAIKSMIHSVPEVYLLNGQPLTVGTLAASNLGGATLVRMLNACYDERIPVVSGYHFELVAEDGRPYPYRKIENAANLPSLKTRDALVRRPSGVPGTAKFYDRRLLSMN